jgi:hypothetical protein
MGAGSGLFTGVIPPLAVELAMERVIRCFPCIKGLRSMPINAGRDRRGGHDRIADCFEHDTDDVKTGLR